jgi:WD40 repeat protein
MMHRLKLHKVLIQSLSFSFDEKYLASLGGQDDNTLVIWDIESGKALIGNPVGMNIANKVAFYNTTSSKCLTVHNYGIRVWDLDLIQKKVQYTEILTAQIKRIYTCCVIDPTDQFAYLGTKTGDLIEISLVSKNFKRVGPNKHLFSQGVVCIKLLQNGDMLIGAGDGGIAKVGSMDFNVKKKAKVMGAVTSISLTADSTHFFCGTSKATIYWCNTDDIAPELRNTCHDERINDVIFPSGYSELFATCSLNDIRVWNAKTRQELLRIEVPGLDCHCVFFTTDGKAIISGWNDGKVRAFLPQSGKLLFAINDAHNHGVTAISATSDCQKIVSGGHEGEIRIWRVGRQTQIMEGSLKEHRSQVSDVKINAADTQAVSSSFDGSTIIWDIVNCTRIMCLFESTMFKQVLYHPDESQVLTTGSNRKITYWDCFDGQAIRMLDGSETGEIHALAITESGEHFVSGGQDKAVKLWDYDEGICYYKGVGHSGEITKICISPDQRTMVSVGTEGAIFMWHMPESVFTTKADQDMPTAPEDEK